MLLDIGPTADGRIPVIMQQRLFDIGNWLKLNGEAIFETTAWKQPYQWSAGKMPEKKDKSFMAGYDINELIRPKKELAHIEYSFTRKGNDLYCIVPAYSPQILIRNFKPTSSATALLLSNNKNIKSKQVGNDLMLDLSGIKPGELAGEMFIIKLKNAL